MLIAVEGIDGSGKGTQSSKLHQELQTVGASVALVQFPRYTETFFGHEIGLYLNGAFGELMSVDPKLGALLYAGDRFESIEHLRRLQASNDFVICDRYTPSNQAHHAAKLPKEKWIDFFSWVERLEYEVFRVPRPDLVVFLDTDSEAASKLISKKPQRSYTNRAADIHEIDTSYQSNVHAAYQALAGAHEWERITCVEDGRVKSEEDIFSQIWQRVSPLVASVLR